MIERKQKILIVHNYYQIPGGEDMVVANEKKLLEDNGHQVVLYTRHNNELKEMGFFRKLLLPITTVYNPRTSREIKRIIRKEGIDIVHVHNTLNLISPSVYYASSKSGVPVIQTIHNFRLLCPAATFYRDGHICEDCVSSGLKCAVKHGCYRGLKTQTLICVIADQIHRLLGIYRKINYLCLTEFNKNKLLQMRGIKTSRVFIKPNFVIGGKKSCKKKGFIFVGRLDELKGIRILISAWTLRGKDAPHLSRCGIGPLEKWCREQTESMNIEMKGFVPNDEARELISHSQALIFPTLWYEGFPMSIVEAYSVGTAVISSDIGNAESIVIEGVTGWKFETGSAEGLVEKVLNWSDISDSVFQVYNEKYTAERNYEMLAEIYKSVENNQ